jgi:preprotein translocase SecE subunit
MAMAVAVKTTPETAPQQPLNRLAVGSLVGTLYVLGCLAIIYGIPVLWGEAISPVLANAAGVFVDAALRLLLMLGVAVLLVLLGRRLIGLNPPHGIRAGIGFGIIGILLIGLFTRGIGAMLERNLGENGVVAGIALTAAVGVALLVAGGRAFFWAGFERWLVLVEDQGWFSAAAYKRNQGQRVRRGTILGILILAGSGIYTLLNHKILETAAANWEVSLPFTHGKRLLLLPDVKFTVPLLLAGAALWCAYRIVNFPVFADFLIATEAELNKVSWTTRRRLVQDTIVVLTTMLLLTAFLFVMDSIWIKALSLRWIDVLQTENVDTRSIDAQIAELSEERKAAADQGDTQKVTRLENDIESLNRQREGIIRGKQGGPQEW